MFKRLSIFVLSILCIAFTSCNEAEDLPANSTTNFEGNLDVVVTRPVYGPGPNMLVHLYISENQFIKRIPYISGKTNNNGLVSFKKIPIGSWYVDCTVPTDTTLYDSAIVGIIKDQTSYISLELKPR
jgi:hypothetical protein